MLCRQIISAGEIRDIAFILLVREESDVFDNKKSFHPDMSHQLFGDRYINLFALLFFPF